ncbi:MAG: Glu/Leu/Phe/Val dehydrogenase [Alphaproteobacteria bacterium]|nr:Glu/Leu/Phe/Val dehydrogenase [Alphaproteobacteria bacterium]
MSVFGAQDYRDHEQVAFVSEPESGLKAIIAIHNTRRGPALGGCRFWKYPDEDAAIADALRLSRGMTYKSGLARLPLGGGKCVVLGSAAEVKTEALLRALGRALERLGGHYVTAEDIGVKSSDLRIVREETAHVAGLPETSGDPSPVTALGVFYGLRAAVRHRLGQDSLEGLTVAVQGLGAVGRSLADQIAAAGGKLIVADIREDAVQKAVQELGAEAVHVDAIYDTPAEVFAPCALGAILNDETIPRLQSTVIAGSANNQLAEGRHGIVLRQQKMLYAPDYAINAGGIINIAHEDRAAGTYDKAGALEAVGRIDDTLAEIFTRADATDTPTSVIADAMAEERLYED